MKPPHIFHNKFVSVIAGFVGLVYLAPVIYNQLSLTDIFSFLAWALGAIFTWKKRIWAVILLALLAAYNLFFDVILDIFDLTAAIEVAPAECDFSRTSIILAMSFEAILMVFIIYYGISTLIRSDDR